MADVSPAVQFLSIDGTFAPNEAAEEYLPYLNELSEADHRQFYRDMAITRRLDEECTNLQRQGQMGLWPPSHGQEAAQVGSARASRPQDVIFPSYREHGVALVRGIDIVDVVKVMRGVSMGGWDPTDPKNGNFRNYCLVIGSHTLHATGYAMGVQFDGLVGTGDSSKDIAVMAYFGDGASSQGDVSEAFVFSASNQTPQVFFLQNNHWAISVPVTTQSRTPLYLRPRGFGIPSVQIDGNDVLASYAATRKHLDDARAGSGPSLIEALTYRIGAHTTSDDPTRYQTPEQLAFWVARDPIIRFAAYLRSRGADDTFFAEVKTEADDFSSDLRRRTLELESPDLAVIFDSVYSETHPLVDEQKAWLDEYEQSMKAGL
ncbi:thiamine pyrophosphate-dependent dehydrogenase E1 component subunit alpha [Subtercola boreus]|uniref:2-oxoisovalerate dehydrogenase subunit alpha n=1 Tax=Subtercola boreus TaxID=120213 RepID=A0A3E0WF58_9MICO|nr:thiamine pyrophosphate-dependent dehydrogenase E1 component subunit alpha [Subtercola boreus]RFA23415.1 pyruvate dehydrogenase (acetyl-transferring) E1 component subunit alpha [Subtercola boreus]RFA23808.1 pyruvate dehydrogenase (acetyl-transferring) E1 component subunit alpha [Subtercola boreus]RFA29509.1 pyruvate dehydrogenase (acetyl-transferring) E1 component subunit alpha [Subtercola boreus]